MTRPTFLWYIPNTVDPGHRGDDTVAGYGSLDHSTELALTAERHGWEGALIGTGWGRPDTFTVATAIAARTTTFQPLAAIRPGYWQPAHFAGAAATLDHLSGGRLLVNIVSGQDNLAAYGDAEGDQAVLRPYTRDRDRKRDVTSWIGTSRILPPSRSERRPVPAPGRSSRPHAVAASRWNVSTTSACCGSAGATGAGWPGPR
jgi:alkanesulfonate monooxygenase SsuD/methylene tetrahydromethanopterin reductase-like flavin-dependent oxidoreductase (luciferase family)